MNRILVSLAVASLLTTPIAVAADQSPSWVCVMDQWTGFSFEQGSWVRSSFRADQKYVLKKIDHGRRVGEYEWVEFGKHFGTPCKRTSAYFICSGFFQVKFSPKSLRFISTYPFGYLDGDENNEDNPSIGIGKCTPL